MQKDSSTLKPGNKELAGNRHKRNKALYLTKMPLRYELRKVQTIIRNIERHFDADGKLTNFPLDGYLKLLARHTELQREVAKKEHSYDKKRVAENGDGATEETVGERGSTGLDSGVPTQNPLA